MSLVIDAIPLAVYSEFTGSGIPALLSETAGLFQGEAPSEVAPPYISFVIVSAVPDYRLSLLAKPIESLRLSFTIISDKRSSEESNDIAEQVELAYGAGTTLTFSGDEYEHLFSRRELFNQSHVKGIWVTTIDYELTLQRK